MTLYITEKGSGRRRKAEKFTCQVCNTEFIGRANRPRKFCSPKCSQYVAEKEPNTKCANCDKDFYKSKSKQHNSKSGLFFCCRKCKDTAQRLGGIKEIMPPHYGTRKPNAIVQSVYRIKFKKSALD